MTDPYAPHDPQSGPGGAPQPGRGATPEQTPQAPPTAASPAHGAWGMPAAEPTTEHPTWWYGAPSPAATAELPAQDAAWAAGTPGPGAPAAAAGRRGPGWLGVTALVAAGMLLSSGLTLGGVVAYDQLLAPEPAAAGQSGSGSDGSTARPASVSTVENPDWTVVAEDVSPSAVAIQVASPEGTAEGTGVVLDEDGTILTNHHVVQGAETVQVTTSDGRSYAASAVGTDPTTDLAVIRLDSPPEGLQPATFADSTTVTVGQPVMALGTPLGLENTVTTGIVSALDRPVTATGEEPDGSDATYTSAIQTDAAINPGNSGGPLVDAAGQVIGINTAIAAIPNASGQAGSIGLGFAIPANTASMIAEQLIEDGTAEHAFLGTTTTDGSVSDGGAAWQGAEVVSVEPDSPAQEAGLREGDLIIGIDDVPVADAGALTGVVRGLEIDSTHTLEVVRDGGVETVEVTLGVRPS
ncbi:S1C family serine protease [Brachybacterium sp. YJGR34]|uniref:S1C family serine protease n=1 Tax=Brachybacterium sp. YJGR34 TaxID=2059911 RepID=UPI000E0C6BB2|nr:trypsin-like peptidase domain-containing protein [Brachybacterium sp. YJGR34]